VGRDDDHRNFVSGHHAAVGSKNLSAGADSHGREFVSVLLGMIGRELARLLPKNKTIVFPNAGHQMWLQDPEVCRNDVEKFLADFAIR
jgi:pimeloyl-ACP methyl ester carboxylesterase